MIYVGLQRKIDFEPAVFPLLYVITAVAFMGLAIPFGQLADRVGKVPVLLAGYALLFVVYGVLLMSSLGYGMLIVCLLALGAYFAATEGVMTALAGAVLPEKLQASGIGILITVVSIGNFALLARLRRPLVRDRPAERRADLRRRPGAGDRGRGAAAVAGAASPRAWIAAARRSSPSLVVLCVVGGGAYVAVAALGPEPDDHRRPARGQRGAGQHRPDGARRRPRATRASTAASSKSTTARSGAAPATSPASGSTTPPAAASAWASPPRGSTTTRPSSTRSCKPVAQDRPDRAALAGAGLRRRPLRGDDGLRHRRLLPRIADRLLDPDARSST